MPRRVKLPPSGRPSIEAGFGGPTTVVQDPRGRAVLDKLGNFIAWINEQATKELTTGAEQTTQKPGREKK